jgi:hypothetical protein
MINKKKEGGFYASKVRLFLNEYDGIPLEEFCKAEKVSYNKMLNCLGRTNHQYHPVGKPKSDKPIKAVEPDRPLLPSLELKELVIDNPVEQEPAKEDLSRLDLYYLGHRSWWLDVKILGLTFLSIVFGKKF